MMINKRGEVGPHKPSNWSFHGSNKPSAPAKWTHEENKRFEEALALFDGDTPDRWERVASMIPGKTASDVIEQYRELVEDVSDIEAGLIPLPPGYYASTSFAFDWFDGCGYERLKRLYVVGAGAGGAHKRGGGSDHVERKKGVPWTEEEHRNFLMGLKKYGKGEWRNIARNFVTTRTPTQVASHAQKYFIRQISGGGGKEKRRSSIHDITTVSLDGEEEEGGESPEKSTNKKADLYLEQKKKWGMGFSPSELGVDSNAEQKRDGAAAFDDWCAAWVLFMTHSKLHLDNMRRRQVLSNLLKVAEIIALQQRLV